MTDQNVDGRSLDPSLVEHPLKVGPTIRPIGLYSISGLAVHHCQLFALDQVRGYLVRIDPDTQNTTILNPNQTEDWVEGSGLAVEGDRLWFARDHTVFCCEGLNAALSGQTLPSPEPFVELDYPIQGVAVTPQWVYLTCQKSGYIHVLERKTGQVATRIPQPGVGPEGITQSQQKLWVSDRIEQTVYCLDPTSGAIEFSILTPLRAPTDLCFLSGSTGQELTCLVAYADEIAYIRDDPNTDPPQTIAWRDRTLIHPLHFCHNSLERRTLSNGYLVEMSYVEELQPLDALQLDQVEWRIALPAQTPRQRLRHIEPVGHPFTLETQDGNSVALFKFDRLLPHQKGLLGWKAVLEVYSMKSSLSYEDVDGAEAIALPESFQERYLVDNDDLAMDSPVVQAAAQEAVGTETNLLRKMHRIRNYVYERLSYGIRPRIDRPDVVLERGIGSCGEYVGVLLALARLNGIACRTIGRYKCPPHPDHRHLPLEPDFNHVWLEFYIPGVGWLPMESNVDDETERGPYPNRFFMGLAWYHIEMGKGIPFEKMTAQNKPEKFPLGNLALNHIRFRILEELVPPPLVTSSTQELSVSVAKD